VPVERQPVGTGAAVSVALCSHNGEKFIVEQLESILGQSLTPTEIVLSDDASTDQTVALARETVARLAKRGSPALVVLANERALGVTANFQQAIAACSGAIIVLSDQDDRWRPDRIAQAVSLLESRRDLLLVSSDARLIDENGADLGSTLFGALELSRNELGAVHAGGALQRLLKRNFVTGATTAFRSHLSVIATPFPSGWVHDEWLAVVAAAVGSLDLIELPLIDYRQHGSNQIGVAKLDLLGKIRKMAEPGGQRNERLLERASALESRFAELGPAIPRVVLDQVRRKLDHEIARAAIPEHRLLRLPAVLAELRTGRYSQFGRGAADAVRDLIQPRSGSR
jgi:hypothetical protein